MRRESANRYSACPGRAVVGGYCGHPHDIDSGWCGHLQVVTSAATTDQYVDGPAPPSQALSEPVPHAVAGPGDRAFGDEIDDPAGSGLASHGNVHDKVLGQFLHLA